MLPFGVSNEVFRGQFSHLMVDAVGHDTDEWFNRITAIVFDEIHGYNAQGMEPVAYEHLRACRDCKITHDRVLQHALDLSPPDVAKNYVMPEYLDCSMMIWSGFLRSFIIHELADKYMDDKYRAVLRHIRVCESCRDKATLGQYLPWPDMDQKEIREHVAEFKRFHGITDILDSVG